jgi:hypothetical protein
MLRTRGAATSGTEMENVIPWPPDLPSELPGLVLAPTFVAATTSV